MKSNKNICNKLFVLSILAGLLFLISGSNIERMTDLVLSNVGNDGQEGNISLEMDEMIEGRIGLPKMFMEDDGDTSKDHVFNISSFDLVWKDITDMENEFGGNGEFPMEMGNGMSPMGEGDFFPMGGLKKMDYEIFVSMLNRTSTAHFKEQRNVEGRTAYVYELNITGVELEDGMDLPRMGEEGENQVDMNFEGMTFMYNDHSQYILDSETSLILDLTMDIEIGFIFPDMTHLQVKEEKVEYSYQTIWTPSETIPGMMVEHEVLVETIIYGSIDEIDENIAIFTEIIRYYDNSTGEILPEKDQPASETYAIDRSTFEYIPGYRGTRRSGLHQFPMGGIEEKDYEMWDSITGMVNTANFIGWDFIGTNEVMVFQMTSQDVEVESGNMVLPIYYHPLTDYIMTMEKTWYLDPVTGMMLDLEVNGEMGIRSSGPFQLLYQTLADFEMSAPENMTDMMLDMVDMLRSLISLSGEEIIIMSMDISFTDKMTGMMVEIAEMVEMLTLVTGTLIPTIVFCVGTVLISIPILVLVARRYRRRKPGKRFDAQIQEMERDKS
jgi:hypothetical protein